MLGRHLSARDVHASPSAEWSAREQAQLKVCISAAGEASHEGDSSARVEKYKLQNSPPPPSLVYSTMLNKSHNAKGCSRPYRQPRGSSVVEASADVPVSAVGSEPLPLPSSPAAAERAETTDVTGTTTAGHQEDPAPASKRVKFADSSPEQEDTGSADVAAPAPCDAIAPVPCDAPEQQMHAPLSDVFAPFLASLDLAEKAAAELLRNERAHWEAHAQALASAHADELRRVREESDASMTALSAELVEARHQLVGRDTAKVEELQAQLAQAQERLKAAEQAVASAMHKSTAAATTLSAVRDAAAAALRRLEA